ncbi:hypothetical protein QCE63_35195 [Caballeronia sp. LZ065]|uniref:hypothetical protein n=1 Tax=Caballeronia sp. LZ065 TaxID=3038571 RepID=UPI002859C0DA|nr:hypothetical protein [Caballeronia sp. LZ065]MDR5784643.1 hypothetical protein [Caballeronia sp. LZ065]
MAVGFDFGAYAAIRDDLGRQYMRQLRVVPRGCVASWMAVGCMVAAEAFAIGISEWNEGAGEARAYGLTGTAGNGKAYGFI